MLRPLVASLIAALSLPLAACSTTSNPPSAADAAAKLDPGVRRGDGYYLTTCARCNSLLGTTGEVTTTIYDGREVLFCGEPCRAAFERDLAGGLRRLDQVMIADQRPIYPVTTSIISGRVLPDEPTDFIWNNRLVRVCDPGEQAAFLRDPPSAMRTLDRAVVEHRLPHYDIAKCLVQGIELDADATVDVVVANRLFRVCCGDCAARVRKTPRARTAIVDYAWTRATHGEPH